MKKYVFLLMVNLIFWLPIQFEFTFMLHRNGRFEIGRILDYLFYIPFIVSLIFGYFNGKNEAVKIGIIGFIGGVISLMASFWDAPNIMEFTWLDYIQSLFLIVLLIHTITPSILAFIGGWFREIISGGM